MGLGVPRRRGRLQVDHARLGFQDQQSVVNDEITTQSLACVHMPIDVRASRGWWVD